MVDYTVTNSDLTFDAAPSSQNVTIFIVEDNIVEGSETIIVTLTSTDPAAVLNQASADITIEDDDSEDIVHVWQHSCRLQYLVSPIFSDYNWI